MHRILAKIRNRSATLAILIVSVRSLDGKQVDVSIDLRVPTIEDDLKRKFCTFLVRKLLGEATKFVDLFCGSHKARIPSGTERVKVVSSGLS